MRYALSKRLIMTNPCEGLELPKGVKKSKYYTIIVDETKIIVTNTSVISKVFFTIEKGKEKTSEIVFTIPSVGVKIRFVFTLKNTPIAVMNIVIIKQITLKYSKCQIKQCIEK
jgi:hypothetical protein